MAKKKVLVVDDEAEICEAMKEILERSGCEVMTALDTGKAWEIFKEKRPESCIIDIHMSFSPFDGVELLRRIREIDKGAQCIMLTCVSEEERGDDVKALGAEAYFEKPLDSGQFDKLIAMIK